MAYDYDLYHRRSSELKLDPEYRVGKLTYVCRIHSNHRNAICGALMLCDCGRYCKIGLPSLYGTGGRVLPYDCPTCTARRENLSRKAKIKQSQKVNKAFAEKRRKKANSQGALKRKHIKEFWNWRNIIWGLKQPVCKRWKGKKGFLFFLTDMGLQPYPRSGPVRRDRTRCHSPENTYWSIPPKYQKPDPQ